MKNRRKDHLPLNCIHNDTLLELLFLNRLRQIRLIFDGNPNYLANQCSVPSAHLRNRRHEVRKSNPAT